MSFQDRYSIIETNADLESVKTIRSGIHRDILDTTMVKSFAESGYSTDFMLYDSVTQEIVSLLLSNRSKLLRGECLG